MCPSPIKLKDINTTLKGVIFCFASVILTLRQNIINPLQSTVKSLILCRNKQIANTSTKIICDGCDGWFIKPKGFSSFLIVKQFKHFSMLTITCSRILKTGWMIILIFTMLGIIIQFKKPKFIFKLVNEIKLIHSKNYELHFAFKKNNTLIKQFVCLYVPNSFLKEDQV